ncbi:MAG TPA: WXG100 family type VII secretion target [Nocardioides sp.]|nr:WXG100 family type VII secretion target [Nocardioides sp.]
MPATAGAEAPDTHLDRAADVVASLRAVEVSLSEVLDELAVRISRLHTQWYGAGAAAHLEAHRAWMTSYADMHEALVAMRRAVRTATDNYRAAAAANTRMWSALR